MDLYEIAAGLRRRPWGLWIGGGLLALDALLLPGWAAWLAACPGGGPATIDLLGILLPTWVSAALGPMAILSLIGVLAIARAGRERGFRVASTVAIAWIGLIGIAWLTSAMPVEAFLGRVVILAFLVQGRMIRPRGIVVLRGR
jgi:hypothetical protein